MVLCRNFPKWPPKSNRCIMTRPTTKSVGANWKPAILHIVAIFHIFTFLLWRTCPKAFIRLTSNSDECHLNKMEIKTTSKIEFSSHVVTVAWRQSLITRYQNTRFCIWDKHGPWILWCWAVNKQLHSCSDSVSVSRRRSKESSMSCKGDISLSVRIGTFPQTV